MQNVSGTFQAASQALIRVPQSKVSFDWNRSGSYEDDTAYVQSIQVDRLFNQPSAVATAALDVTLNNASKYFDTNGGSAIAGKVTIGAPVKVNFGFGSELINLFNGLISSYPTFDILQRTVEVFGYDAVDQIGQQATVSDITGSNMRVGAILTQVMTQLGYAGGQYSFSAGVTVIPTVDIPAGTQINQLLVDLMIVEVGQFWVDEAGLIRFQQRNSNPFPAAGISLSNDMVLASQDLITSYVINSCTVTGPGSVTATFTNSASVTQQGLQALTINNSFVQDNTLALDLATYYVTANSSPEPFHIVTIRALPQLQLGDLVIWNNLTYQVVRIKTTLSVSSGLTQDLTLKSYTSGSFFTVGASKIGGIDEIAP